MMKTFPNFLCERILAYWWRRWGRQHAHCAFASTTAQLWLFQLILQDFKLDLSSKATKSVPHGSAISYSNFWCSPTAGHQVHISENSQVAHIAAGACEPQREVQLHSRDPGPHVVLVLGLTGMICSFCFSFVVLWRAVASCRCVPCEQRMSNLGILIKSEYIMTRSLWTLRNRISKWISCK